MKTQIGIIGFGQMSQFMTKFLNKKFEIFATDIKNRSIQANKLKVKFTNLKEASSKNIVILAVPIGKVKETMIKIKPFLRSNVLLLDVSSAKVNPMKAMKKYAPKNAEIIGTHPLFGPQSGAKGIKGLKIILCPIKTTKQRINNISKFLKSLGLQIIITTPEKHDKAMAETQALAHFIGRALININVKQGKITTPSFQNLMNLKDLFKKDSIELFKAIETENPYAKEVRKKFLKELKNIEIGLK